MYRNITYVATYYVLDIEIFGVTCSVQTESVADSMAPTAAIIGCSNNQNQITGGDYMANIEYILNS